MRQIPARRQQKPQIFSPESRVGIVDQLWQASRDILKTNSTCGIGRTQAGQHLALVPILCDRWIANPSLYGEFLGTINARIIKSQLFDMLFDREERK